MPQPKLTAKQSAVLDAFEASGKPTTPQEVWERIGTNTMGLATVYRAVRRLIDMNLLRHVEIADAPPLYEATAGRHHHHFYCRQCGEVFEIRKCPPQLDALVPPGFRMDDHSITLYGLCAKCLASGA